MPNTARLAHHVRSRVPHFDSIVTLSEEGYLRDFGLGAAMESAFLLRGPSSGIPHTNSHRHHEAIDCELDLSNNMATIAGLSVGLFSGAALTLSHTLADVVKNGAECLRVSLRLGVYVAGFSSKLEAAQPDGMLNQSWAHVVTGMTEESIRSELAGVNDELGNPNLSKVFVSAADKSPVSVSGPPSRVKTAFLHSSDLRYSKSLPLPVYDGLSHAEHLYSQNDVSAVLNPSETLIPHSRPLRAPLPSSKTGAPFAACTAGELLTEAITDLITGTIYVDLIVSSIIRHIGSVPERKACRVNSLRTFIIFNGILEAVAESFPGVAVKQNDLVDWVYQDFGTRRPINPANSKLAIVGMACRMPGGANDPEAFWEFLEQGRDACTTVPPDRFDLETHYDPTGKIENAAQTPYGNFIDRPGYFDAAFFVMSPKEAEQTDPMQRLAITTTYEAMERAGLVIGRTPSTRRERIGSYYGQASDDWRELNASQNIGTYAVPGGVRGFTTGRINYFFKLAGPCLCIDTACSSSMAAVHAACMALWAGEVDVALAGGVNIITDSDNYAGLFWDKDADGYCRAEGIGSIVIKRLEDAEADNDNILVVVLSAATNHCADAISITHPHPGHQKDNCRRVLRKVGVSALDVSYVEMHGTGTQAGDTIESESLSWKSFRPSSPGVAPGLNKDCPAHFQKNAIPRHIGIRSEVNPLLPKDLERRNAGLVFETTAWPRPIGKKQKKRTSIVNSFGAHGGNTTLLLEDAPERHRRRFSSKSADGRSLYAIAISAKSKKSLDGNLRNLLAYVDENPETDLADLSYTLCARRTHHNLRVATTVSSISNLRKFLRSSIDNKAAAGAQSIPQNPPSVVFTFTGQGTSNRGVRQELFDESPAFRTHVLQLDQLVQRLGFPSVLPALTGSTDEEVMSPVVSQLSIVVLEIALARFWALLGVRTRAFVGHSLGEYAALEVAGVFSAADVLYLVGRRAQITDIQAIQTVLEVNSYKCVLLEIPFAYHTSQMDAVIDELEQMAQSLPFKAPSVPFLSTLLRTAIFDGKTINATYLRRQTRGTVKFAAAIEAAYELGLASSKTAWVELGPHPICVGFVRKLYPGSQWRIGSSCRRNEDNISTVSKSLITLHLAGITPVWNEFFRPNEQAYSLLSLPNYNWNETNYWIPYLGTWALDKALLKYGITPSSGRAPVTLPAAGLRTSTIHQTTSEVVEATTASLHILSYMQAIEFRAAVQGHTMNNSGVATSSIWTDMALAVGEYLSRKLVPQAKVHMNVCDLEVLHAQPLALEAQLDLDAQAMSLAWYNVSAETGERAAEWFASPSVRLENADAWAAEWNRTAHLVMGRIEALRQLATNGVANRISKRLAYTLFKNVVDYADWYRGIDSVMMHEYEAVANITLVPDRHGSWHTPPHWIDSVCHLAGLVMNGSDASNTQDFFYVTPGSDSFRLLRPLEPGAKYASYVRMFPLPTEAGNMYAGDVYILQDAVIIVLMNRFFSPPAADKARIHDTDPGMKPVPLGPVASTGSSTLNTSHARTPLTATGPKMRVLPQQPGRVHPESDSEPTDSTTSHSTADTSTLTEADSADPELVGQCIKIIARESKLALSDLTDDASISNLGVDSLMALVFVGEVPQQVGT
ncbi:ketoacyl-synt-domain-containing protein [Aspergillus venezuelensis]